MVINAGTVIEPPGLYRDYLLSRGLIELDVPDEPTAEVLTMAIEPELNMAIEPKKRRRGRPPKVRT